jgi:hypothetical protein
LMIGIREPASGEAGRERWKGAWGWAGWTARWR